MPAALLRAAALVALLALGCGSGRDGCDPCASSSPPSAAPTALRTEPGLSARPTPVPGPTDRSGSASPGSAVAGAWSNLGVDGTSPAAREDHTWTVDPAAGVAYLFGGRDGADVYGDLWSFDLATEAWSELAPAGGPPAARFGHEAVWVPGRGLVVLLGQAGSAFFNDLWLFDPGTTTWQKLPSDGDPPVPRYGSCSGIGPDGRLWMSHGFTEEGSRFFDTRAYDFNSGRWTDETPADRQPVERCLHACWWTDDGDFVLYGGQTTGVAALGDLWLLDPPQQGAEAVWSKLPDPEPAARQLPAVARRGAVTVLFGGRDVDRAPLGDAWVLPDPGGPPIAPLEIQGPAPSARSGASLIYDEARDRMLLFGGIGDDAMDDLWELAFD
jgi:hypothetical protein